MLLCGGGVRGDGGGQKWVVESRRKLAGAAPDIVEREEAKGQDFDALLTDEEIMSFLRDLGHIREIHSLNDVVVDQMHQPWRTFAALINRSLSVEEPTRKSKRVKRSAKKSTQAPRRGVVIKETPEIPVSNKKEKVDVARGKGIELLSDVALNEDAQFEEVRKKSAAPGISSILNLTCRGGGSHGKSSGNTLGKLRITGTSCNCFFAGSFSVT
nr:hypothetical protein [Tanacetum cinerariifolium]